MKHILSKKISGAVSPRHCVEGVLELRKKVGLVSVRGGDANMDRGPDGMGDCNRYNSCRDRWCHTNLCPRIFVCLDLRILKNKIIVNSFCESHIHVFI